MCGLLVEIARDGEVDAARFSRALDLLAHRGPDGRGVEIVRLGPGRPSVALGHRRLAILDLDPRAGQPMRRGARTLVYNGEIYDYRDHAAGLDLSTSGDAEVLLGLLAREGVGALARLNGMWALALLDENAGALVAARDRYGKKPLFWWADARRAVFASELAPLLELAGLAPRAGAAVDGFVAGGWLIPAADGATHIEGVREVRPGAALRLDLDGWRFAECEVAPLDVGDPAAPPGEAALPELLAEAVRARLVSDRKVGLMLSGGVDSTLILSILAAEGLLEGVTCVTGEAGKSDDGAFARACVAATGARAIEVPLDYGEGAFETFLDAARRQEKPFPLIGNVLGLHRLYAALAAEGVVVALDGAGADEIFGGYWARQSGFALREAFRAGDEAAVAALRAGGMLPARLAALDAGAPAAAFAPAREGLDAVDVTLLTREGAARLAAAPEADPLIGFSGSLRAALVRDARGGRLQEWLWQNDRNAMASGVENRSPFLDPRLAAYMAAPAARKFAGAANKLALRALFARFLPLPSAARLPKQGFRYVWHRFARRHQAALIDLVASSALAARYAHRDALIATARADAERLASPLAQRLATLAALEATGRLTT